jgi:2-dehydro-3-deoxyphosphogluconate aldolase/(4S)-4-hydroxy-2-oxoglutarate aldolase
MHPILRQIAELGIVPVVVIDDAAHALPLAQALLDGGLPIAEITFRTAAAEEAIRTIANALPDVLLGAGTVLTVEQAQRAIAAGARFIVSPGLSPPVACYCLDRGIAITPGCATPSEIMAALALGLEVVKFFPADALGGVKALKAIGAPFPGVRFIPTGGVDAGSLVEYLALSSVLACGGSWLASASLIRSASFAEITRLAREAVSIVTAARSRA